MDTYVRPAVPKDGGWVCPTHHRLLVGPDGVVAIGPPNWLVVEVRDGIHYAKRKGDSKFARRRSANFVGGGGRTYQADEWIIRCVDDDWCLSRVAARVTATTLR